MADIIEIEQFIFDNPPRFEQRDDRLVAVFDGGDEVSIDEHGGLNMCRNGKLLAGVGPDVLRPLIVDARRRGVLMLPTEPRDEWGS